MKCFILFYQGTLSIYLGGRCRFYPSCSHYAVDALESHSVGVALKLIAIRILKCRPGGEFGFDPCSQGLEKNRHV